MATQKVEIDPNKELQPGDRIELVYQTVGGMYVTAAQIAMIEAKLEGNPHFRIDRWSIPAEGVVSFEVTVLKTSALLISAMILAVGIIGFLILRTVYQIMESSAAKTAAVSSSLALLLLGAAVLLGAFRGR